MNILKKTFLLFSLIFNFFASPAFAEVEIDFQNLKTDEKTREIAWNYIINDNDFPANKPQSYYKENFGFTKSNIAAYKYDLNNNGTDEVLFIVYSTFFSGRIGFSLYILEFKNNTYKNISLLIGFQPKEKLIILENKTNGFNDLKMTTGGVKLSKLPISITIEPAIAKYNQKNGFYEYSK